jgi:prefoldin subunit 5
MASNLDYLDPALLPLEDKVKAYLEAEENLRQALQEAHQVPQHNAEVAQAAEQFEQRPPTGSFDQHADDIEVRMQALRDDLDAMHQEILDLLPTRDEWVKVNLGYGPSRVGAWFVPASAEAPEHYEVRVVH